MKQKFFDEPGLKHKREHIPYYINLLNKAYLETSIDIYLHRLYYQCMVEIKNRNEK